ncbi:MAG: hypothetical protein GKS07_10385 [Nitrosopumilus sp.]|nr:MAG: hypothetical protein GKS07_10385 [Nitrosopumilus sp.]
MLTGNDNGWLVAFAKVSDQTDNPTAAAVAYCGTLSDDFPLVHLSDLDCTTDQIAKFDGTSWVCDMANDVSSISDQIYSYKERVPSDEENMQKILPCHEGDIILSGGFTTTSRDVIVQRNQVSHDGGINPPGGGFYSSDSWIISLRNLETSPGNYFDVAITCLDLTP